MIAQRLTGSVAIIDELQRERRRLRQLLRSCGILLASSVLTDPQWTEAQRVSRRKILADLPKALKASKGKDGHK